MTATAMESDLRTKIMAIMKDTTMSEAEKARKRQELLMGNWSKPAAPVEEDDDAAEARPDKGAADRDVSGSLDENLKCAVCLSMCERPVTAPCQHNFCLGCFKKWTNQGKKTCPNCRAAFPSKFAQNPRINTALAFAIRLAKNPPESSAGPSKDYKRINNESRPDQAFVTDRAVRNGRANAASGRIMVSVPNDHFGPIGPEHDPSRNQGVLVGEWWKDRLDCRQWGAHFPHVAGIAGQSNVGAQSVVLSGGYEDDRDEGEWFVYTGSGGRDLSGNKRTSKVQSFDQDFENMNKALKLSCIRGLPVRVVRSCKEKRSSYAPTVDTPVRYDGVYRILRCWRKPGNQSFLMCRYLFVRCDNSPAPWSSGDQGDVENLQIPEEAMEEIEQAKGQVFEMSKEPIWGWLPDRECWGWTKEAPVSQQGGGSRNADPERKMKKKLSEHEKALKEFKCGLCCKTLSNPLSTPCGHNFCKGCLDGKFEGVSDVALPNAARTLRVRRNLKPCPTCKADLCEFLAGAQVNREMAGVIQNLKDEVARSRKEAERMKAEQQGKEEAGEEKAGEEEAAEEEDEEGDAADPEGLEDDEPGEEVHAELKESSEEAKEDSVQSGPAVGAGPSCSDAVQAPPAQQQQQRPKYAAELAALSEEFSDVDAGLLSSLLEDQGGSVLDVRAMVRKMQRPARQPPAAAGRPGSKRKGKQGSKERKAEQHKEVEEVEEAEEVEDAEEEVEEVEELEAPQPAAGKRRSGAAGKKAEGKAVQAAKRQAEEGSAEKAAPSRKRAKRTGNSSR